MVLYCLLFIFKKLDYLFICVLQGYTFLDKNQNTNSVTGPVEVSKD